MSTKIVDVDFLDGPPYLWAMLAPEQSRSARAWLEWSQEDLAKKANVSLSTVRDFEKGRRVPIANNLEAIGRVLQAEGVEFLHDDAGNPTGIKREVKVG
jgi:ribosome-binding protein aMBF1 (putative translation factor)